MLRSFGRVSVPGLDAKYDYSGDQNEMGRACGTHGGEGKCMLGFGGETRKKETAWKTRRSWEDVIRRALIIARSCDRC